MSLSKDCMPSLLPEAQNVPELRDGNKRFCPLCQAPVRLFYINFHDKFQMCENTQCEYPFGYKDIKIIRPGDEISDDDEGIGSQSKSGEDITSISSDKTWSDTDKMNQILFSEDLISEKPVKSAKPKLKPTEGIKEDEQLLKNLQVIRVLNEELSTLNEDLSRGNHKEDNCKIRNEKWIKKLKALQDESGVQLLRPDEMGLLKKDPVIGVGELKIDIGPGNVSTGPSIRIEIHNTSSSVSQDPTVESSAVPDKPTNNDPLPV